jgi:methylenetetrahydrofolate reductase (NADPH)
MKTFGDAIREKEFAITVGITGNAAASLSLFREHLATLRPWVDALQFGYDESTDSHITPLAASAIALEAGIDPIVHFSCRDRNRFALQSEILGALSIGVSTLILRRGEKLPAAYRGRIKGVFDTKSTQLLALARHISEVSRLPATGDLKIGCLVQAMRPRPKWNAQRVIEKLEHGANLLQTRPSLDISRIRAYVARLVSLRISHRATIIVSVPMVTSAASLQSMSEHHPGTKVPATLVDRLSSPGFTKHDGIALLAETIQAVAKIPGVSGIAIVNVDDADALVAGVRESGALAQGDTG